MGGVVAAVDAPSGQIDDDVATIDRLGPGTKIIAGPGDSLPLCWFRLTTDHGDVITVFVKVSRKQRADLPGAPGDCDSSASG